MRFHQANSRVLLYPCILIVFVLTLVTFANAPPPASVNTYKEDGTPSDVFFLGEKVIITTYFDFPPYLIRVLDPHGNVEFSATSSANEFTELLADITDEVGTWTIELQKDVCARITETIKVVTLFVIPDVASSVIALIACFAGFGFWIRIRKKDGGLSP